MPQAVGPCGLEPLWLRLQLASCGNQNPTYLYFDPKPLPSRITVLSAEKRQEPGTLRYQCHEDCGQYPHFFTFGCLMCEYLVDMY